MMFIIFVFWITIGTFIKIGNSYESLMAFINPTDREPAFDSYISHVVTIEGSEATLPCSVDNLNKLKVVWLDTNSVILTLGERRIVDDTRFSVDRIHHNAWNLIIKDVRSVDAGRYLCAVNTHPVKNKMVELTVKVPAKILDTSFSKDQIVREGSDVTIACRAAGVPKPVVTWIRKWRRTNEMQREQSDPFNCVFIGSSPFVGGSRLSGQGEQILATGEVLTILNITRSCSDDYKCFAENEISPTDSKDINVQVEFPPAISPISKKISQSVGKETILECEARAFPHAINYWEKGGQRLKNSEKFRIEAYNGAYVDILILSLRIFNIEKQDFGSYVCIAANSLGKDKATVLLEEHELSTSQHLQYSMVIKTTDELSNHLQFINQFKTVSLMPTNTISQHFQQRTKQVKQHQFKSTTNVITLHVKDTVKILSQESLEHYFISNMATQTRLFVNTFVLISNNFLHSWNDH